MPRRKSNPAWDIPPLTAQTLPPLEQEANYAAAPIKVPPRRKPKAHDDMAELRRRAARAASESRSGVTVSIKVPKELYRVLVELAEEYHRPISEIARQALSDGARKYRQFSTPGLNPFSPQPSRVYRPPVSSALDALALAARTTQGSSTVPEPLIEDDEETLTSMAEVMSKIPPGALFPQTFARKEPVEDTGIFEEESVEENN